MFKVILLLWIALSAHVVLGQDVLTALSQTNQQHQQDASASEEEANPEVVLSPMEMLEQTLNDIYQSFIERLPYLGAGLVIIIITWIVSRLVGGLVYKVSNSRKLRKSLCELFSRLSNILVWILGLLIAAMIVFPGLTPAKALGGLGLVSVAVGLAFKEIFENFFAGILLLWKYPFETGDFIECESILGRVENISVRMTQIRKTNGELVVTPNSILFKNPVKVLTDRDVRRITVMTGVAYDEDADQAAEIIEAALKECETVDQNYPIEVFLNGFGASSIDIEVTWWTTPTPLGQRQSRSEVVSAVKRALDNAGIEIPFPYRTLTFKEPLSVHSQNAPRKQIKQ